MAQVDGPRALRPEEYSSALGLINSALRPNGPPRILEEYPLVLGKENLENMRVIVKGKEVLSHAAIYLSKLRAGDLFFKVGGVGSVATHPAYRGQGLASAVIRDCIEVMQKTECHLSVLWTQRYDFYRNLGYETAGSEYLFRARAADFAQIQCDCKMVPYHPRYLPEVIKIHEREVFRTERTRREYEAYLGIPKARTLLATRGSSVSAYAVMGKGEDFRHCIHEWGGDANDLLCLVREFAASSGLGELIILAPVQESTFTQHLRQMGLPKVFEYLAMIRTIDVGGLSSVLSDCLSSRLGRDFRILRADSCLKLRVGNEETVIDREQTLARVLFGPGTPSQLLRGFSGGTLSALDSALPIPLFIWGLDSV